MDTLLVLGIDWQSMLMYVINFGILFFFVAKYLVPKILHFLDERKHTIEHSINEANRLKADFQNKLAEMENEKEEAKLALVSQMEEMKKSLETKKNELVSSMEKERRIMLEKAQEEITERKDALIKEVEGDMLELIKKIVLYVLQNKLPEEVVSQSVKEAWTQYKK